MKIKENINKPRGFFRVYERINSASRKLILDESNLIVTRSRNILQDLFVEPNTDNNITKIKFVSSGVIENDDGTKTVKDPNLSDEALFETDSSKIYTKDLTISRDGDYKVKYTVTLESDEVNLNGSFEISEAGLFTNNDKLFSHKCFPIITKTEDRVFDFEWTIEF